MKFLDNLTEALRNIPKDLPGEDIWRDVGDLAGYIVERCDIILTSYEKGIIDIDMATKMIKNALPRDWQHEDHVIKRVLENIDEYV